MMRSWNFSRKLGVSSIVVAALTIAIGIVAFYALRTTVESKDQVITVTAQNLIDAASVLAETQREVANVRGFLLTGDERFLDAFEEGRQNVFELLERIGARGVDPQARVLADAIENSAAAYRGQVDQLILERTADAGLGALAAGFEDRVIPAHDMFIGAVQDFVSYSQTLLEGDRQRASDTASRASALIIGVAALTVAFALFIGIYLVRTLTGQIGSSVEHVRSSSAELRASASQQASGAKEQATAMNEISTTINELLTTSRQIAESAQRVSRIAGETADNAREGDAIVNKAQEAVESIRQQVETVVEHMLALGKKSQEIGGILEIINELAEQTNILAINATIEAAGAGEAGRRFAVVGEEIRKLADRVGSSTKEIRSLIEEIRAAVNTTVMATEAGSKAVESGSGRFADLALAFRHVSDLVETTTEAAREIELSTKQQTTAVEQVNMAINDVSQTTRETEAGATQTLETASQLAVLSDELARLVQTPQAAA